MAGGFFHKYPFLLPNLLGSVITIVAFVLAWFYLPETRPIAGYRVFKDLGEKAPLRPPSGRFEFLVGNTLEPKKGKLHQVFTDKVALMCCLLYGTVGFTVIIFEEVFPLWALLAPYEGGLSFSSQEIGIASSISAVFSAAFQMLVYPPIVKKTTILVTFSFSCALMALPFLVLPEMSRFVPTATTSITHNMFFWVALVFLIAVIRICTAGEFVSVVLMVNNSVSNDKLGTLNGIGQSIIALFRALGPTIGAVILAWSSGLNENYFLSYRFIFVVMTLLTIGNALAALGLPYRVTKPLRFTFQRNHPRMALYSGCHATEISQ